MNVLLVTLDTTRADRLHCYGNRDIETAHFDALASEGILFNRAVAVAPLTMPAHSTIMTGLTPMAHGVRDNGHARLGDGAETMAEILKSHGYETAAVLGAYVLDHRFGLGQGFDHYDDQITGENRDDSFHFLERSADRVSDAAIRWLDGRKSRRQPFFLWVHYFDAHAEYKPPSPYRERYARAPYDGEIAFVDGQVGRVIEELRRQGLWERTMIVVVGDHGESLGEHGEETHSLLLYEGTLRIPLIMSHPEGRRERPTARWKPRRIETQAGQIDILPTVAEAIGITLPRRVEGRSLVPLLDGKKMDGEPAYSETLSPLLVYGWAPLRSLQTNTMQYIRAPESELYDLTKDPGQRHNIAPQQPEVVSGFEQELQRQAARAETLAIPAGNSGLSEAERAKLASLGYLQGGGQAAPAGELDPKDLERPNPKDLIELYRDRFEPGRNALDEGDGATAERLLRAFLEVDPGCGEAHFYLGVALRIQGRLQPALDEFKAAERLSPRDYKIPFHQGIILGLLNHPAEARTCYMRSRGIDSMATEPLTALGSLEEREGRPEKALAFYDRVLQLEPDNAVGRLSRGIVLGKLGKASEAAAEMSRAAELVPRDPDHLERFGRTLGEQGHPELARPLFEELARKNPDDPAVHASLGNCHLLAGENAEAAKEYSIAARLAPGEAQYYYLLGCAYAGLGDHEHARGAWQHALDLNPRHAEARYNLEILTRGGRPG